MFYQKTIINQNQCRQKGKLVKFRATTEAIASYLNVKGNDGKKAKFIIGSSLCLLTF